MALRYVGRYATSRAKLIAYLSRKVRERGWSDAGEPGLDALADRFCALGYVDDASYALAKAQALSSRGYGKRRLGDKLRLAGIDEDAAAEALEHADAEAVEAALRFAKRRRLGPFASRESDARDREKAIGAMVRAGHSYTLAREIADMPPGAEVDKQQLYERTGRTLS
jgi:regulatory protein